jgi:hypothetical protein
MKRRNLSPIFIPLALLGFLAASAETGLPVHPFFNPILSSDTGFVTGPSNPDRKNAEDPPKLSPLRFDATYGNHAFQIIWNTISEKGCDHFDIERSFDGVHFEKLGEVRGTGPCTRKDNFFYKDEFRPSAGKKNDFYYRLKQVETGGAFSYSKLLVARVYNSRTLYAMSITPDPDLNDILINVQLKENAYIVMKLADSKGNELMRRSESGNGGLNIYKMDESNKLKPGTYSLEVIVNSNERMNLKVVKA